MIVSLNSNAQSGVGKSVRHDAVVVGAGPYGLSIAAHLLARGLKTAVFGKPMDMWLHHMPAGMYLRSRWWASNLSSPHDEWGLDAYLKWVNQPPPFPLPARTFIDYGLWFQRQAVPCVDETQVDTVERAREGFQITLVDGRQLESLVVVMAPGLLFYHHVPALYANLPKEKILHTSMTFSPDQFASKRVAVIGAGQSAVEWTALLHESGARTHLVARHPILWLPVPQAEDRPLWQKVRRPTASLSNDWVSWGLEHAPYAFQRLSRPLKDRLMRGIGPAAAHWLKPRVVGKATLFEGQQVGAVLPSASGLTIVLTSGEKLDVDYIVLGTGYQVDVSKLPMLAPSLLAQLATYQGAPILSNCFESNMRGLYFAGLSAVSSCGPLFRFVVGTRATAPRIAWAAARDLARLDYRRRPVLENEQEA